MGQENSMRDCFISPNVADSNGEPANIVDVVHHLARGVFAVRNSITANSAPGSDYYGGHVECLAEAVMGITRGLGDIADALREIAGKLPQG